MIQSGFRHCGFNYMGVWDTDWPLFGLDGGRAWSTQITFLSEFENAPDVVLSISGFSMIDGDFSKLLVNTGEITTEFFYLVVQTWGNTQIHGVSVSWIAYTP